MKEIKEKCKHKNKAFSKYGVSTNNGATTFWICKDCGFEGSDFTSNYDEYEKTRQKFGKN